MNKPTFTTTLEMQKKHPGKLPSIDLSIKVSKKVSLNFLQCQCAKKDILLPKIKHFILFNCT